MDEYSEVANAKLLIVIGHSEYWTRQARLNFDRFVDTGNHAMILSGNSFWWQVRYQEDPKNPGNPQLVCYKSLSDPIQDPLQKTIHWWEPSLNYSILKSIGADSQTPLFGRLYAPRIDRSALKDGYKIILDNSPLLIDYNTNKKLITNGTILRLLTGEFDGTILQGLDTAGHPIINTTALGFYKTELLGYATTYEPKYGQSKYAPLMVFQKTKTSGKVINVNSNSWCGDYLFNSNNNDPTTTDGPALRAITQNMINRLLYDDNNIFVPTPIVTPTDKIQLYPNPTENYLIAQINKEKVIFEVYSLYGTIVYQTELEKGDHEIDISDLPTGTYIVKITSDKSTYQMRVTKK